MHKYLHLMRRGGTYYWRRKARRLSTCFVDWQVSLRTTDRARAVILCRRLTADSEQVLEAIEQKRLTQQEARAFLRYVVQTETERLNKIDLLNKMDCTPGGVAEDARHDWAHKMAWSMLANVGVRAAVTPQVEAQLRSEDSSDDYIETLEFTLDLLKRDVTSEANANRRAADFRRLTGRDLQSAIERLQLMQLYIEGKAASHERGPTSQARALTYDLLNDGVTSDSGFAYEPVVAESSPAFTDILPNSTSIRVAPTVACQDGRTESGKTLDSTIHAVVERMLEVKSKDDGGLEKKTADQYRSFASLLIRVVGKTDIRQFMQSDAVMFRSTLQKLPKSFGKSPADKNASITDVLDRAANMPVEKVGMAISTVNRYIDHFAALVTWVQDEGFVLDPRLAPGKLRRKEKVRSRNKKRTFKAEELRAFFQYPVWTGANSDRKYYVAGSHIIKNGTFWVPLLCAYTGLRREEAAGLGPDDLKRDQDIWYLDIDDTELRRVKTTTSKRRVPLHRDLMSLGFVDHVKAAQAKRQRDLFPDLYEASMQQYGRKIGRRMERIVSDLWASDGVGLSLQSMRHYVQHVLDLDPSIPSKVSRELIGHEGRDIHESTYGDECPIQDLKNGIEKLPSLLYY